MGRWTALLRCALAALVFTLAAAAPASAFLFASDFAEPRDGGIPIGGGAEVIDHDLGSRADSAGQASA